MKYINKTQNEKIINYTKQILFNYPNMLIKDFLLDLIIKYNINEFSKFYEYLYNDLSVYDGYHQMFGLII